MTEYEHEARWLLCAAAISAPFVLYVALRVVYVLTGHAWSGLAFLFSAVNTVLTFFAKLYQAVVGVIILAFVLGAFYFYITAVSHHRDAIEQTVSAAATIVSKQNVTDHLEQLRRLAQNYIQ